MSNYPDKIDVFSEKLNKRDTVYVIEEEVTVSGGIYEAPLCHDNVVDSSVRVYSGSKLTGERIDNFILSIPEGMKWKRIIKIFTSSDKVYISYETTGDQVEAEDINNLQESMTATQIEIERYKTANDLVVTNTVNRVTTIENKKAEKTYVDGELLKKADKVNTYTKAETDARIQNVVGAAPEALDTLQELGAALNNDPNFAATVTNELSKKVDKVVGKQLTTEDYSTAEKTKLAGMENGANKYVHPATHLPAIIVQDANNRFVTDAEKAAWNAKETPNGAQNKVDTHANDGVLHVTDAERTSWNAKSNLAIGETSTTAYRGDRGKIAYDHSQATHAPTNAQKNSDITKEEIEAKLTGDVTTHLHSQYVTKSELENAGNGDMLKSGYDTNNDGVIDRASVADAVSWANVLNKPTSFTPSNHGHEYLFISDIRNTDPTPDFFAGRLLKTFFNNKYGDTWRSGISVAGWHTGYAVWQLSNPSSSELVESLKFRVGIGTAWNPWRTIWHDGNDGAGSGLDADLLDGQHASSFMKKGPLTWNDLKGV